MYYTMTECLKDTEDQLDSENFSIPTTIPEEVAHMAVHLTEYYQSQRLAYEQVHAGLHFI